MLERGSEYLVWVNPLNPGTAYICDIETRYLGTARVIVPVRRGDMAGIQEQMRVVRIAEADLRRRLAPIAAARQRTRLRDRQHNIAVLSGALDGPRPTGDGFSLEELNGCDTISSPADSMPIGRGSVAAGEDSSSAVDFLSEMSQV